VHTIILGFFARAELVGAAEWVKNDGGNDNRVAGVAIRPMAATEKWLTQRISESSEMWNMMDTME
jgi:hypothetical protein